MTKKLLMLSVALAAAIPLMADEETVGGGTWTHRISGGAVEM